MTYLAANMGNTAMLYRVYDAKACRMRLDIFSVDDLTNVYVETEKRCPTPVYRAVKSNRIIIPPVPGTIVINAIDDESDKQTEVRCGQKTVA